jgi:hypothetical protein
LNKSSSKEPGAHPTNPKHYKNDFTREPWKFVKSGSFQIVAVPRAPIRLTIQLLGARCLIGISSPALYYSSESHQSSELRVGNLTNSKHSSAITVVAGGRRQSVTSTYSFRGLFKNMLRSYKHSLHEDAVQQFLFLIDDGDPHRNFGCSSHRQVHTTWLC